MPNYEREQGGVLIQNPKSSEANRDVRRNVEKAGDWKHQEIALELYRWNDRFMDRFIRPIEVPGQAPMPTPVLSFERFDVRAYAYYLDARNSQGLLYEIGFNTVHLDRPLWELLETLLHEQVHLWQQNFGKTPSKNAYHNKEFVERAEQFGLHPKLGKGHHTKQADGPFALMMKEYGVKNPAPPTGTLQFVIVENWWDILNGKEKGRSTLSKWQCPCGQIVRVGKRTWPGAVCNSCGHEYIKVEKKGAKDVNPHTEETDQLPF